MKPGFLIVFVCGLGTLISCQKSYNPPGVVVGGGSGTGGGGTGTTTSALLKIESKTNGSSEGSTTTYQYDGSGRMARIVSVETDSSNVSVTYFYRYVRDPGGKVSQIVTNILTRGASNTGLPDSLTINVHYPAGSAAFDYTTYNFSVSGVSFRDSAVYVYTNGSVTDQYQYQAVGLPTMAMVSRVQYIYGGSNLATQKIYEASSGSLTNTFTLGFEYDAKTISLNLGLESFLPGLDPLYSNKNNHTKATFTDHTGSGFNPVLTYSYQYNANNLPVTGTLVETPGNKTTTLKFTYQ